MTDPAPLTDDEVTGRKAIYRAMLAEHGDDKYVNLLRLVATVEQTRRERDAAYACIRRWLDGWELVDVPAENSIWWKPNGWDRLMDCEVDAIRRALAEADQ